MKTIYSHLAGAEVPDTRSRAGPRLRPAHTPAGPKPDSETKQLFGVMRETLDYLKLEPAARAKREAEPLLAQERAAAHERESAASAEREAERAKREEEAQRLREIIRETDAAAENLRAQAREHQVQMEQAAREHGEALEAHRLELETLRARPGPTAALPAPAPPPAPKPEDFGFEYRKDVNGLLTGMTIQAPGYASLVVEVVRGADNRMRHIKVRNP